jgi:hypothetical protein
MYEHKNKKVDVSKDDEFKQVIEKLPLLDLVIDDVLGAFWGALACVSNCDSSFARKSKLYSLAVKIESVQIKCKMVVFARKAK